MYTCLKCPRGRMAVCRERLSIILSTPMPIGQCVYPIFTNPIASSQRVRKIPCSGAAHIQSYFDSSNTDGSFTMANSNLFLSPYEILPIA